MPKYRGQIVEAKVADDLRSHDSTEERTTCEGPKDAPFNVAQTKEYAAGIGGKLHGTVDGNDGRGGQQARHDRDQRNAAAHADDGGKGRGQEGDAD